jgi:putative acetyltransferase
VADDPVSDMNVTHSRPLPRSDAPFVVLFQPVEAHELEATRRLFRDYADAVGIDLGFQDFEEELASLPGDYAEPRGRLFLALVEVDRKGHAEGAATDPRDAMPHDGLTIAGGRTAWIAGCCALRPLDAVDYPNAAEMKRLYVRPAFRGLGLGRQLAEAVLDAARHVGYGCVLLDTLDDMESARALYEDLGFEAVPPYYHNPIAGSHYLKADL